MLIHLKLLGTRPLLQNQLDGRTQKSPECFISLSDQYFLYLEQPGIACHFILSEELHLRTYQVVSTWQF